MMYNRVYPPLDTGRINIMVVEVKVDQGASWKISFGKEKVTMARRIDHTLGIYISGLLITCLMNMPILRN